MSAFAAAEFLPLVATADATTNSIVVSLHDIAPGTQQIASKIISELAFRGVRTCSLLVVPDYHHQGLFAENRQFVSWLHSLESVGHEIVIHGYFHQRPPRPEESLWDKLVTRFYTQNEGEFYDLSYDEALQRITAAQDAFRAHGFKPCGFIAPAWLLGDEAERAVCDAQLEYTTRLGSVRDLRSGNTFSAMTLVYSVQSSWRRALSTSWNTTLFRLLKSQTLLRMSIHPPDYSHRSVWEQILRFIAAAKTERTATTYQNWIAEQRSRNAA